MIEITLAAIAGFTAREWVSGVAALLRRKRPPPPPPLRPREVGDIVCTSGCALPVVLLEKMTHQQFRACYITPHADQMGAKVKDEPHKELDDFLAMQTDSRAHWSDYTHDLSDIESANYAKAMIIATQ